MANNKQSRKITNRYENETQQKAIKSSANAEKLERMIADKEVAAEREAVIKEQARLEHQLKIENIKKEKGEMVAAVTEAADTFKDKLSDSFSSGELAAATTKLLTSTLDPIIDNYISKQQSMAAHLYGTGSSLSNLNDTLQDALSTSSLVKQSAVYDKLYNLVNSGITYNVEQRAFLQTLADDINLVFNAANGSLTRLIRLQGTDLTANRLAIEYSLQTFLNQNYQTSEYIQQAFTGVSDALTEMQSLVSASDAVALEATIQEWLGSYYSAGANQSTVTNLAAAINSLGSGDISNLGQGISNLVLMGVARAGLDYGNLLNSGVSTGDVSSIMSGITSYLGEMGSNSSNVVKSQLASLFGVNVSDLIAASNMKTTSGGVTTDIYSSLLNNYSSLVPTVTRISNVFDNMMYSWGTNIASNDVSLLSYKLEELVADNVGTALASNEATKTLGNIIKSAPLLTLIPTLLQTVVGDVIPSLGNSSSGLAGVFDALASGNNLGSVIKMSTTGTSGSAYIGNGSSSDLLNSTVNSATGSYETIGISGDEVTLDENVKSITDNVQSIFDILDEHIKDISDNVATLASNISSSTPNTQPSSASSSIYQMNW